MSAATEAAAATEATAATEAAADTEAELEEARSQLRSCQSVNMRTATDLQVCQEQLHRSQRALQQSENEERDTVTGAFTAAYACSNAALLTLPNVSCQQLGPLRTAVAAAEFPDAPPQPQAGPSTVRRHQLMLTRKIQGTFKSQLSKAPAVHVQMDGCTIKNGKVVLFCASASIPAPVPSLPTSSLTAGPPTPLAAGPPTPLAAGPPTPLAAGPPTPLAAGPPTPLAAGPPTPLAAGPPTPLAAGPPTPLAADPPTPLAAGPPTPLAAGPPTPLAAGPPTPLAAGPPTPAQILTHGQEPSRILCRVLDIRKCPDSTAAAQAHDLEQLLKEANLWELLASVTVDSAASNVGRTGGLVALVNLSRRRQGLALIMFWPCLSHLYHNVLHQGLTAWGKAEDRGRQGLSAEVAFSIERLCSLIMGHWDGLPNMGGWSKPSFPTLTRWGSFVTACLSLTRVLGPVTKAVAIIMEERGALAPDWAAELSGLLLNTTFTLQVMVVAVVGQQIIMPELGWAATGGGMHAFEVARHVEALSDSLLGALVDEDFPELFSRAQELVPPSQWEVVKLELVHLITQHIDAMFKYLGAHSKVYLQLPHLLPAMASSDATYAAHAARRVLEEDAANRKQWEAWEEQQQEEERQQDHGNRKRMRRSLPPQSCNPAEYDPFNTISMFRADIEAMAANEACSPRLFMHLVHFFGAAPTSNAHVESALQHAKHGHGSKQGLAALLGTVIAKTDPASFRAMDAVDLQPRMKALRKEQRDMERASAAKTAVARAARKAVTESCMVGGNKQLVLNIGTVASLGQLRAASSRHPRGADYSATTLKEAAAFTLAQLWGYINFYKIPPKHRPAQKTLLQNLRRFVKQHIEQRTKAALSSGPGCVA
ncbi:hypothetical protein QJQ45_005940 [Haematococcus lacustris]|nr:hypothetical protein QJQ45_005940 [Haematococcus lacustris]